MAAGVALVTFANGGQSEYMRNNTFGIVVGPKPTVDGMANAVEWLMQNPVRALNHRASGSSFIRWSSRFSNVYTSFCH